VAVDVLSQDAVRIRPGTPVMLEQWGGETVLRALVSRIEPHGFTRVSALGVEERRVRVVADLLSPAQHYAGLGAGYRVLARFVVWEEPAVLQIPTAALFRTSDGWAVFVVHGGRAVLRPVSVGQEAGLAVQILAGLDEGEVVVVHAGNDVADGVRVRVRTDR
jgi:HlyD family secretion protein